MFLNLLKVVQKQKVKPVNKHRQATAPTNLCTLIASFIPIYFMIRDCKELLSQRQNCWGDRTDKAFTIKVAHRKINHPAVAPHSS